MEEIDIIAITISLSTTVDFFDEISSQRWFSLFDLNRHNITIHERIEKRINKYSENKIPFNSIYKTNNGSFCVSSCIN